MVNGWDFLLDGEWLPVELSLAFERISDDVLEAAYEVFDAVPDYRELRLHGDCHPGNLLWRHDQAHFVDLDDAINGPAIQDLWMLLAGDANDMRSQWEWLVQGYREFRDFDVRELALIEALRSLRLLHYNAWLARRWEATPGWHGAGKIRRFRRRSRGSTKPTTGKI